MTITIEREEFWELPGKTSSSLRRKQSKRWSFLLDTILLKEELAAGKAPIVWPEDEASAEREPAASVLLVKSDNKLSCSSQCELVFCYLQPQEHQNCYIHFITQIRLVTSVLHPCRVNLVINPV